MTFEMIQETLHRAMVSLHKMANVATSEEDREHINAARMSLYETLAQLTYVSEQTREKIEQ